MEPDLADHKLVLRIRTGDAAALEAVMRLHWSLVVNYAASLGIDRDSAEDAAQQTFVRLWERRETLRPEGSLRGLLCRIARNMCFDDCRRRKTHERAARRCVGASEQSNPLDELVRGELRTVFESAVNALPGRRREVFKLVRYYGLSHREVGETLDIAPQTVANHLGLALADLRVVLAPYLPDYFLSSEAARKHLGPVQRLA